MAGRETQKVRGGQQLKISAGQWNAMLDAARKAKGGQFATGAVGSDEVRQSGIVKVRNATGADVGRFGVLGIDSPIIAPAANLAEFKRQVAIEGVTPNTDYHRGRFVILLEPLAAGAIGRACISGVCAAQVTVADPDHRYADISDGVTTGLVSNATGGAQVLWKDPGSYWGIVRLGPPSTTSSLARFRLLTDLSRCSSAHAVRIETDGYSSGETIDDACPASGAEEVYVYDPLGLVPRYHAFLADSYVWAAFQPDSQRWEVIAPGAGCCGDDYDSSGDEDDPGGYDTIFVSYSEQTRNLRLDHSVYCDADVAIHYGEEFAQATNYARQQWAGNSDDGYFETQVGSNNTNSKIEHTPDYFRYNGSLVIDANHAEDHSIVTEFGVRDQAALIAAAGYNGYALCVHRTGTLDNSAAQIAFARERDGSAVQNADQVGNFYGMGWDGNEYVFGAGFGFEVNGAVSDKTVPMKMVIKTSPNKYAGLTTRLEVANALTTTTNRHKFAGGTQSSAGNNGITQSVGWYDHYGTYHRCEYEDGLLISYVATPKK